MGTCFFQVPTSPSGQTTMVILPEVPPPDRILLGHVLGPRMLWDYSQSAAQFENKMGSEKPAVKPQKITTGFTTCTEQGARRPAKYWFGFG